MGAWNRLVSLTILVTILVAFVAVNLVWVAPLWLLHRLLSPSWSRFVNGYYIVRGEAVDTYPFVDHNINLEAYAFSGGLVMLSGGRTLSADWGSIEVISTTMTGTEYTLVHGADMGGRQLRSQHKTPACPGYDILFRGSQSGVGRQRMRRSEIPRAFLPRKDLDDSGGRFGPLRDILRTKVSAERLPQTWRVNRLGPDEG
jgi:hypothetical protein